MLLSGRAKPNAQWRLTPEGTQVLDRGCYVAIITPRKGPFNQGKTILIDTRLNSKRTSSAIYYAEGSYQVTVGRCLTFESALEAFKKRTTVFEGDIDRELECGCFGVNNECPECGCCRSCCDCPTCDNCGEVITSYDQCSNCYCCENCCDCWSCSGCGEQISDTEPSCECCDMCEYCCRCPVCDECGGPVEDVCPDCDICEECGCRCDNDN